MDNSYLICKPITEIATIERAQKDKLYPVGTCYIQVSACKRAGENAWQIVTDKHQSIESKYAVVIPNIGIVPKYLFRALEAATPEWHKKYVGTNINISMDAFEYLKVRYNPDILTQMQVVSYFESMDSEIELIEEQIEMEKGIKKYFLHKMFPKGGK